MQAVLILVMVVALFVLGVSAVLALLGLPVEYHLALVSVGVAATAGSLLHIGAALNTNWAGDVGTCVRTTGCCRPTG